MAAPYIITHNFLLMISQGTQGACHMHSCLHWETFLNVLQKNIINVMAKTKNQQRTK